MEQRRLHNPDHVVDAHSVPPDTASDLGDLRFRALVSSEEWSQLPPAVRKRFSKRVSAGSTVVYTGEVSESRFSRAGWFLAQAARAIGGPLPTGTDVGVPSVVTVTEDMATGGQIWTRLYARRCGFPQIIHSSKRFSGSTGLEEHIGRGIGMALTVHIENGALVFRSAHYFFAFGRHRMWLPRWLAPGALCVTHADMGGGRFKFSLEIIHPFLGCLIKQSAVFQETVS